MTRGPLTSGMRKLKLIRYLMFASHYCGCQQVLMIQLNNFCTVDGAEVSVASLKELKGNYIFLS